MNNFLTGDIAEAQIYNASLTDTDRLGVERALKCKYGISGGATLAAPTGLTGVAGNRKIFLNWALSSGATGYNLSRSTNAGATYELVATNLAGSSYVDASAANGLMNYYRVAANDACGAGANSGSVGVFLPLPALGMVASENALTLSWPGWASDWTLFSTTNLAPPVVWTAVPDVVSSNNGQFDVSIPIDSDTRFFRLIAP